MQEKTESSHVVTQWSCGIMSTQAQIMEPSTTTSRKKLKFRLKKSRPYPRPENRSSIANFATDPSAAEASTRGPSNPVLATRWISLFSSCFNLLGPTFAHYYLRLIQSKASLEESQAIVPESEESSWEAHLAVSRTAGELASSAMAAMVSGWAKYWHSFVTSPIY